MYSKTSLSLSLILMRIRGLRQRKTEGEWSAIQNVLEALISQLESSPSLLKSKKSHGKLIETEWNAGILMEYGADCELRTEHH